MPGPILPNTGIQIPSVGADIGVWDDILNNCWENYDEHDHTPGKGLRIPSAALNINADVAWGGKAINALGKAAFAAIAPLAAGSITLFVSNADNELYWRTSAGVNVKLTLGTSINTTLVGGIVGDYTAVGAEVAFDDGNDRYTFKQQGAPKTWARIACGDVRIYETGTSESVYVGHKAPAALAASYDVTWPVAAPASSAFMMMDAAGIVSVPTSPTVTGTITAADFRNTTGQDWSVPGCLWQDPNAAHVKLLGAAGMQLGWLISGSGARLTMPLTLRAGDRVTGWGVYVKKNTDATNTITARLYHVNGSVTGTESPAGPAVSDNSNAPTFISLSQTGLDLNVITGDQLVIVFTPGGGITPAADLLLHAYVTVTRP